ncbi:M23 family metallopeptidase [Paenibacillus jiagnxiensis]|uniref:M23 family metallopeptidase n=1 Tax=Paenibacillus jiagnxiensis TaxID=3228926 RepID=UPI0033A3390D
MPFNLNTDRVPLLLTVLLAGILLFVWTASPAAGAVAAAQPAAEKVSGERLYDARIALYRHMQKATGVPWQRLAAIDQYERTLTLAHPKDRKHNERITGIYISEMAWSGWLNPDHGDSNPASIDFFDGYGQDGSGDGIASRDNDKDLLYTMASHIASFGKSEDHFNIALWEYYHNPRAVQRIQQFTKLYQTFGTLDLHKHAFPLPLGSDYSYRSTWGSGRNWGGYRIHEGTDLFAGYGVPVRSTCYGVIEVKGWNPFGGWRIGIRDIDNRYHYYAHLQGFEKNLHNGDIVKPGQTIGWVGSSGYGKPGTQGKFPPHLHYGIYRDSGLTEWSFDPYPLLRKWEQEEKKALKANKKAAS